jgi:hypothetical protein
VARMKSSRVRNGLLEKPSNGGIVEVVGNARQIVAIEWCVGFPCKCARNSLCGVRFTGVRSVMWLISRGIVRLHWVGIPSRRACVLGYEHLLSRGTPGRKQVRGKQPSRSGADGSGNRMNWRTLLRDAVHMVQNGENKASTTCTIMAVTGPVDDARLCQLQGAVK